VTTERAFIVRTRGAEHLVPDVADITVADGHLVMKDADEACVAIFAAGDWLSAGLADDPSEGEDA
jgi:hypothetical protein